MFKIKEEELQLKFTQKDIHLSQNYPLSSLKLFKEVSKEALPLIAQFLEIKSFDRIGNRIIYLFPTKNLEEAENVVKNTGLLNIPDHKINLFDGGLHEPHIRFKIQNENYGYAFNVSTISRILNVELPKPLKVDSSELITNAVSIDVDYYTRKAVDLSIIDFEEIINKVQKDLKHNLPKLLS